MEPHGPAELNCSPVSKATNSTLADGIAIDSVTNPITVTGNKRVSNNVGNGIARYGTTDVIVKTNIADSNDGNGICVGGPGSTGTGSSGAR
jgi:hypothetical protein